MKKLESITAFFPAFNDGGTISSMVISALITLPTVTDDYEVIIVNESDELIAVGKSLLNHQEMLDLNYGIGVKIRRGIKK